MNNTPPKIENDFFRLRRAEWSFRIPNPVFREKLSPGQKEKKALVDNRDLRSFGNTGGLIGKID